MKATLNGRVETWALPNTTPRRFAVTTVPYGQAVELFMPYRFNAITGKGEQRDINPPHCRNIKRAMLGSSYTPTAGSVGLAKKHRENLKFIDGPDGTQSFSIDIDSDEPLPLLDAGHRIEAITTIVKEAKSQLALAKDQKEKDRLQATIDAAMKLPIPFIIQLDGDTQVDFLHLQEGRKVDASHIFTMNVKKDTFDDDSFGLAVSIAKLLHKDEKSPFKNLIRFDSRGDGKPLPINTICSKGASDLGTSLIGLARVGQAAERQLSAEVLASCVVGVYQSLSKHRPDLLDQGKVLQPIGDGGTRGSATLLIGLAVCVAYRLGSPGASLPDILSGVEHAAAATLDESVSGGFAGSLKRHLLGRFARNFLINEQGERHDGLPVQLLKTLSPSTFEATPLPKPVKAKKGGKKAPAAPAALPDVDSPLPPEAAGQEAVINAVNTLTDEVKEAQESGRDDDAYEASEKLYDAVYDADAEKTAAWEEAGVQG